MDYLDEMHQIEYFDHDTRQWMPIYGTRTPTMELVLEWLERDEPEPLDIQEISIELYGPNYKQERAAARRVNPEFGRLFDPNFVAKPDPPVKIKEPTTEIVLSDETKKIIQGILDSFR